MHVQVSWHTKVRFFASAGLCYAASLTCIFLALKPPAAIAVAPQPLVASKLPAKLLTPGAVPISGRPIRISIPSESYDGVPVDLKVIPGTYDPATDSWTLSGYDAQFDMSSTPANNSGGLTFIYGHNNDYVFGALRHKTPDVGAEALIYTGNNHIFTYTFEKSWSVNPNDVATLEYKGPPVLLIQTCTGSLNEWRTMYLFKFERAT